MHATAVTTFQLCPRSSGISCSSCRCALFTHSASVQHSASAPHCAAGRALHAVTCDEGKQLLMHVTACMPAYPLKNKTEGPPGAQSLRVSTGVWAAAVLPALSCVPPQAMQQGRSSRWQSCAAGAGTYGSNNHGGTTQAGNTCTTGHCAVVSLCASTTACDMLASIQRASTTLLVASIHACICQRACCNAACTSYCSTQPALSVLMTRTFLTSIGAY